MTSGFPWQTPRDAASASTSSYAGGFVGKTYAYNGASVTISDSYATGVADAADATNNYEGGFAGSNSGTTFTNCWWYNSTNSTHVGTGASTGISKATGVSDFYDDEHDVYTRSGNGWDFTNIWQEPNNTYPLLERE